jgi:endoglucanase
MEKEIISRIITGVIDFPSALLIRKCIKILVITLMTFIPVQIIAAPTVIDYHIKVDQFGYTCTAEKIAVISNPDSGYNSNSPFSPGTGTDNYQIRQWSDDAVVFSGTITAWNSGSKHTQSGDKVWWFDFSSVSATGSYYVYDVSNAVGSCKFEIGYDVYQNVLKAAVRMYYYQRCGIEKLGTYAGASWQDAAVCHNSSLQDTDCRLYTSPDSSSTSKDLSGGWHDAGDYNKYVNFAGPMLINLLMAYQENPSIWTDDYNIPESGNSVPDLLDEAKWELDWLLKMQQSDGSLLSMVGNLCPENSNSTSPPSIDVYQRVYGPATTSATLSGASAFALAAIQFKSLGIPSMTAYANTLQTAAINAWTWASANGAVTWQNNSNGNCYIISGEQEIDNYGRSMRKLITAAFLYKLTAISTYKTFFESNYTTAHIIAWGFAYPFEEVEQSSMLYYTSIPGITSSVSTNIKSKFTNSMKTNNSDNLPAFTNKTDAYRAYLSDNNYTWGSNAVKSNQGNMFQDMLLYNLDATNNTNYLNASSGFLHYLHGVNPTGFCYLTNMSSYGGDNSITTIFHRWFADGSSDWDQTGVSTYGPAPGFLSGGPNRSYSLDGCCSSSSCGSSQLNALCSTANLIPPLSQPKQKSYKDWNAGYPQDSWAITEPSTGYQSAYVRMLSKFVLSASCGGVTNNTAQTANKGWNVFPNPAEDVVYVSQTAGNQNKAEVSLLDVIGSVLYSENFSNGDVLTIHLDELPSGIYFLCLKNGDERLMRKLVKQ